MSNSFFISYTDDDNISVYGINSDTGAIDTTSSADIENYATTSSGEIELLITRVPDEAEGTIVVVENTGSEPLTVKNSSGQSYVTDLTNLGDNVAVQIVDTANLKLVSTENDAIATNEAIPTAGVVGVEGGVTLTVVDGFTVKAELSGAGTIDFSNNTLKGNALTVVADSDSSFTLTAGTDSDTYALYTVNGASYKVVEDATVVTTDDSSYLSDGAVALTDSESSVALADKVIAVTALSDDVDADGRIIITMNNGIAEISKLDIDDTFTITESENAITYTMTDIGY